MLPDKPFNTDRLDAPHREMQAQTRGLFPIENGSDTHAHAVQFYESDASIVESVAQFIAPALSNADAAVVIATPAHREQLDERLKELGVDLDRVRMHGQYATFDAVETLSQFMRGASPDAQRFDALLDRVLIRAANGSVRQVRVFGEMVAILWGQRQHEAALALERLWNDLAKRHSFSLLCGYPIGIFATPVHGVPFQSICDEHSRVVAAESFPVSAGADVRMRVIADLQQRAATLQSEIEKRRAAEQELNDFFDNAAIGLHWVGPDGIILRANRAELDLLGYPPEEYVGHHIAEFHADQATIDNMLYRLTAGETLHDYEARLRCKDGSIKHVLINSNVLWQDGHFVHTRCFTRDITDRKHAEAARADAERRRLVETERIAEAARELAGTTDVREVAATTCRLARSLLDADGATFVLRDGDEVHYIAEDAMSPLWAGQRFATSECISGWAILNERIVAIPDVYQDERIPRSAYRSTFVKSLLMAPVCAPGRISEGGVKAAIGVYWATSRPTFAANAVHMLQVLARTSCVALERARLYDEARQARLDAERANRAKDEFLSVVSHELRTPLASMLGWVSVLKTTIIDPKPVRALQTIERSGRQQAKLIEDLLDVSSVITGQMRLDLRLIELPPVLQQALDTIRPAADAKGVRLETHYDPAVGPVAGDADRLQQIVWNLLSNAVKFTPAGGVVALHLDRLPNAVRLVVKDTGRGISREFLACVFERFRQADSPEARRSGGVGLGLAIARHLVELHGGSISVASDGEGRGATFTVLLPLNQLPDDASGYGEERRGRPPTGRVRHLPSADQ